MPYIDNLEYENLNALRSYPIRDGLSKTDISGLFVIPNDFIVDIQIAPGGSVSNTFFISQIINELQTYILTISDNSNNVVGTFTIPSAGFIQNSVYYLTTVPGNYNSANGSITIGSLNTVINQPAGIYNFSISATELLPKTIIVSINAVNQLSFTDSLGNLQTLTNFVNVEVRNNLRFTFDSVDSLLLLDAGNGLGLNTNCTTPTCVQSINGIVPDPTTGNISFIGLGCSTVSTTTTATLTLNDSCCTPCSDCTDLSVLTSRVNQLETSYNNIKNFYNYLNTELTAFNNTVSASCVCPS